MKLYTEEDMIRMYNFGYGTSLTGYGDADIALQKITPIELPSDEEMQNEAAIYDGLFCDFDFIEGAKWVIEQIKKQDK